MRSKSLHQYNIAFDRLFNFIANEHSIRSWACMLVCVCTVAFQSIPWLVSTAGQNCCSCLLVKFSRLQQCNEQNLRSFSLVWIFVRSLAHFPFHLIVKSWIKSISLSLCLYLSLPSSTYIYSLCNDRSINRETVNYFVMFLRF